jgi:hypothetical protein
MIPRMKTLKVVLMVGLMAVTLAGMVNAGSVKVIDAGARYHMQHSDFETLPYADGDMTYCAGLEFHEANALIQLICGYTPEFSDYEVLDYGITPEANLLMKDGVFQGGLGILSTYTNGDGEWMDLYWQWVLGLNFPLGKRFSLQANAYYVYEDWGSLGGFDFGDIEYGGYLGYKF